MKAYCINLDRRPDRMVHMDAQFNKLSLTVERFSALDAESLEFDALEEDLVPSPVTGKKISAGAYACFLSHRAIWKKMCDENIPHAVIFEDDLILSPSISNILSMADWPSSVDILKLETFNFRLHLERNSEQPFCGRKIARMRSYHPGTGSYALSREAAELLLQGTMQFSDPVDMVMFSEHYPFLDQLNEYQVIPAPVIQGDRVAGRMSAEDTRPNWAATSILERDLNANQQNEKRSSFLARLSLRSRNELRGLVGGTRYVVVPHG